MLKRTAILTTLLWLAACAGGPDIERDLGTSTREARLALELAADDGPIAGRVADFEAATATSARNAAILDAMADAVPALGVRFTDQGNAPPLPVLVVRQGLAPAADPCGEVTPGEGPTALGHGSRVTVAFCDEAGAIGAVSATLEGGTETERLRLYRRLSRELFPDLYGERYGIGSGPFRFNLGGAFSF